MLLTNLTIARFQRKIRKFRLARAISYICFQVRIVKKKREKKSHTINYYGKSGDSRTPGPRQGLYTRNCNGRNYSFYHSWRPSWRPLFAENSRASGGWAPGRGFAPGHPARGPTAGPWTPPVWEESHVSDTHTQLACSQSFIIAFSRVSGRYVKHFSDAKVQTFWLALSARSISFFSSFLFLMNISRVLRTQSWTYCTDKQWLISNVYIEIWEESYVFNADI